MKQATSIKPSDSRLWYVWGNLERDRNRYDRALEHMQKAQELSPDDPPVLGALGEIEKRRGNYEEASMLLLKSIQKSENRWNRVVCFTSLADTLRRWALILLKDKRKEDAVKKLKQAYDAGAKAVQLGDDFRAKSTLGEVCLNLGQLLLTISGLDDARPYLEQAIVPNAKRMKERKTTEKACYELVLALIREGKRDEAKEFYLTGRSVLSGRDSLAEKYRELGDDLSQEVTTGKLARVVKSKGYGFLKPYGGGADTVYLHVTNVVPLITVLEFDELEGCDFSFVTQKGTHGPNLEAKRARLIDTDIN